MAKFLETKSIGYNDVVLIAQPGKVHSRKQVPIEGHRIVVAAMTAIVGPDFLEAVSKLPLEIQPTVQIPRDKFAVENVRLAKSLGLTRIFVGCGLNTPELEAVAKECGYDHLALDVANGYLPQVKEKVKDLKNKGFHVITGSVHTQQGAIDLANVGTDIVKSGIGPGSVCITSATAGYTRAPITDILALTENKQKLGYKVLADGGLATVADVSKAFLSGADYIMSGRLFVNAHESRLRVDATDVYYGMASAYGKQAMNKKADHIEGKSEKLSRENLNSLEFIINDIWDGLRSAVSYSGHTTLTEAIGNGVFELKHSK